MYNNELTLALEGTAMYYVYILASQSGYYYTGCTSNLYDRIKRHRTKRGAKYTKGKKELKLVYHEEYPNRAAAMKREKQIKNYSQKKKCNLISKHNR